MTARRQARSPDRRRAGRGGPRVPANLAAGPCIEVWAKDGEMPSWSARIHWVAAREAWAEAHGLQLPDDYRHLPRSLRDRAPYHRDDSARETRP